MHPCIIWEYVYGIMYFIVILYTSVKGILTEKMCNGVPEDVFSSKNKIYS